MFVFVLMGVLFLVFSMLFFFAPRAIVRISEIGNKLLFTDERTVAHRFVTGMVLLLMSLIMIYVGFRM